MKINVSVLLAIILICIAGCGSSDSQAALQSSDPRVTGISQEFLTVINATRTTTQTCNGITMPAVSAVNWNDKLALAALRHSADMASHGMMDHKGTDNSTYITRVTDAGYAYSNLGENIAWGYPSVTSVIAGWMSSTKGHCEAIMNANFTEIGAAKDGTYWTLDLARPK